MHTTPPHLCSLPGLQPPPTYYSTATSVLTSYLEVILTTCFALFVIVADQKPDRQLTTGYNRCGF